MLCTVPVPKKGRFQEGTIQVGPKGAPDFIGALFVVATSGYCWHYFVRVELGLMRAGDSLSWVQGFKNCCPPKKWRGEHLNVPFFDPNSSSFFEITKNYRVLTIQQWMTLKCLDGSQSPWLSMGFPLDPRAIPRAILVAEAENTPGANAYAGNFIRLNCLVSCQGSQAGPGQVPSRSCPLMGNFWGIIREWHQIDHKFKSSVNYL